MVVLIWQLKLCQSTVLKNIIKLRILDTEASKFMQNKKFNIETLREAILEVTCRWRQDFVSE